MTIDISYSHEPAGLWYTHIAVQMLLRLNSLHSRYAVQSKAASSTECAITLHCATNSLSKTEQPGRLCLHDTRATATAITAATFTSTATARDSSRKQQKQQQQQQQQHCLGE